MRTVSLDGPSAESCTESWSGHGLAAYEMEKGKGTTLTVQLRPPDLLEASGEIERHRSGVLLVDIKTQRRLGRADVLQQRSADARPMCLRGHEEHVDLSRLRSDEPDRPPIIAYSDSVVAHAWEVTGHELFVPVDIVRRQETVTRFHSSPPDQDQLRKVLNPLGSDANRHGGSLHHMLTRFTPSGRGYRLAGAQSSRRSSLPPRSPCLRPDTTGVPEHGRHRQPGGRLPAGSDRPDPPARRLTFFHRS
jgi:hypothetical protein